MTNHEKSIWYGMPMPITGPMDHIYSRPDRVLTTRHEGATRADLYVLMVVFNSPRYRSRLKLYQDTAKRVKEAHGILCTAEITLHDRDFVLNKADPIQPDIYLPLLTNSELWVKEAAQNLLVQRLPLTAKYILFLDADVGFARDDIFNEIVQSLQRYDIVQPWSEADDLGPNYDTIARHYSFVYSYHQKLAKPKVPGYYGRGAARTGIHAWHPGFAQAWRRSALDICGGLIWHGVLGAGDNHMMKGLIGDANESIHPNMTGPYRARVVEWQTRAAKLHRNIGYVPGKLLHYFHGKKVARRYWDRWRILVDGQFNPDTDLAMDWQGLPQLVVENERQAFLRDKIREYFLQRDEDGTEA